MWESRKIPAIASIVSYLLMLLRLMINLLTKHYEVLRLSMQYLLAMDYMCAEFQDRRNRLNPTLG